MLKPKGRVVMVSGAARGLGPVIAKRLYDEGYTLSLGARDPAVLERVHGGMEKPRVLFHKHDAKDPRTSDAWVAATVARFGRLDGLVNNAGVLHAFSVEAANESQLDEMWTVNAKGPVLLTRAALPHLKKSGQGRVVNVASLLGLRVRRPDYFGYSMSKFALVALTHAIRQEGFEHGVRATALCPSVIDTDMGEGTGIAKEDKIDPETLAEMVAMLLALPNTASVAELPVNIFAEASY